MLEVDEVVVELVVRWLDVEVSLVEELVLDAGLDVEVDTGATVKEELRVDDVVTLAALVDPVSADTVIVAYCR